MKTTLYYITLIIYIAQFLFFHNIKCNNSEKINKPIIDSIEIYIEVEIVGYLPVGWGDFCRARLISTSSDDFKIEKDSIFEIKILAGNELNFYKSTNHFPTKGDIYNFIIMKELENCKYTYYWGIIDNNSTLWNITKFEIAKIKK